MTEHCCCCCCYYFVFTFAVTLENEDFGIKILNEIESSSVLVPNIRLKTDVLKVDSLFQYKTRDNMKNIPSHYKMMTPIIINFVCYSNTFI